jgi:MFS family permease
VIFFRGLVPWAGTVVGGSFLTAWVMVIHSDFTQAEMPYNPDQVLGVTFMSSIGAAMTSLPTLLAMLIARHLTQHRSPQLEWRWVQGAQALGAALTFGYILCVDWDVFSVACAVCYPLVGFVLWHRHLQASNR